MLQTTKKPFTMNGFSIHYPGIPYGLTGLSAKNRSRT